MPLLGSTTKQPSEIEKYAIYYGNDINPDDNFTIDFVAVTSLDGLGTEGLPVIDSYAADAETQRVIMFISGGTAGCIYKVTVRIMTNSGRRLEDEFKLKIRDY